MLGMCEVSYGSAKPLFKLLNFEISDYSSSCFNEFSAAVSD